jgi:hypothetical protein
MRADGDLRRRLQALLTILAAVALSACAALTDGEAVRVLKAIEAGEGPSALKAETPAPNRRTAADGAYDLYIPGEPARAGLVLTPGLTAQGKDDPRMVALADVFARARFVTLVPEIPGAREMQFTSADSERIAAGVRRLDAELTSRGVPGRLGVAAISYAVAPAVLASLEEAERVDFMISLGGYFDAREVVAYVTTGHVRDHPEAAWRPRRAHPAGRWFMAQSMAAGLTDPDERAALQAYVESRIRAPKSAAPAPRLGRKGQSILDLAQNRDPERVAALIDATPPAVREGLDALSLHARDLSLLAGKLVLIHGEADSITPPGESVKLAEAVPGSALFLAPGFSHIELKSAGFRGQLVLAEAMSEILRRRDGE